MTVQAQSKKRLLAINFGGIGDEILFLPTLESIALAFPDWEISLLCEPRSKSIAQITDLIDQILTFDIKKRPLFAYDLLELQALLRGGNFDLVLSSGSSQAVAILLFISGIETRIGYDSGKLSRFLLSKAVPLNKNQYAASMYHDLVRGLGIETNSKDKNACLPQAFASPTALKDMGELMSQCGLGTTSGGMNIVIHPGTSKLAVQKGIIKTWPSQSWVELIALLAADGLRVVIAGGPDDETAINDIHKLLAEKNIAFWEQGSQSDEKCRVFSFYGLTKNLADLAALIQLNDVLVCVDSAPMHLAVALGKNVVALFGPTDAKRLLPQDRRFCALETKMTADQVLARTKELIQLS